MRGLAGTVILFTVIGVPPAMGQQADDRPVVYLSRNQIPWDRTDSLAALLRLYPDYVVKARELGHVVDIQVWIHMHGDEWNVAQVTTFPSWQAFANQKPGWGDEVFRLVEPDSVKRAAFNAGWQWVFKDTPHRDNIYVVPKQ